MTFFRSGGGAAARAYLEQDHARADDYYLAEGTGLADRIVYQRDGATATLQASRDVLTGDAYEAWVDWRDPLTGEVRGTPRERSVIDGLTGEQLTTATSPRFAEMTVNADKTLSIAAALNPAVSTALDAAMRDAAEAMTGYLAEHSVTRVGPLGGQRLVDVDRFEAAYVMHQTSRAGDPHRHAHLQFSTRVFADGKWRALDTATTLRQQGALRGIGEATINAHPQLRAALVEAGFTFDPTTGRVVELEPYAAGMSKRAEQIGRNRDQLEAAWRTEHPGVVPGPAVVRSWDRQAWNLDRPDKKPTELATAERWTAELVDAGYVPSTGPTSPARSVAIADLDRAELAAAAIARAQVGRSAWSVADLTDAAGHLVAASGVIGGRSELTELIEDVTARAAGVSVSLADPEQGVIPEALRHLTSAHVVEVDAEIHARLATRSLTSASSADLPPVLEVAGRTLDGAQRDVVAMMAGDHRLIVFEGAAGAGKTTALLAARQQLQAQGREQVIVAPTLKAAQEAGRATGADASSLHALVRAHGWRWTDDGTWYRLAPGDVDRDGSEYAGVPARFRLASTSQVVVDEAGMVDQEAGRALLQVVDEAGASLVLAGDRAQKGAVGRGGFFDAAAQRARAIVDVTRVHRFLTADGSTDQEYAALSLQLRDRRNPGQVFDQLTARGLVHVHDSIEDARAAIATAAADALQDGHTAALTAVTNEEAARINAATRAQLVDASRVDDEHTVTGVDELPIGRGDLVMTRKNDRELGVANRETYTVTRVHSSGRLTVADESGRRRTLDAAYVAENVHLAYAVTGYGNQGATTHTAHLLLGDSTAADDQYVGLTRGRTSNHVHLVAVDLADARKQFVDANARDAGDRGLQAARDALTEQTKGLNLAPAETTKAWVSASINSRINELREKTAKLRAEGEAHDQPRLEKAVQAERNRRAAQVDRYENALQRRVDDAGAAERRAAWIRDGRPLPEDTRTAVAAAEQRLVDAAAQLEALQERHNQQVTAAAAATRTRAQAAGAHIIDAERAANAANVFTRSRARDAVDAARQNAAQQLGMPVPEDTAQLWNQRGDTPSWIDRVTDRARQTAAAQPDAALAAARAAQQQAQQARDAAAQLHQATTVQYQAEVRPGRWAAREQTLNALVDEGKISAQTARWRLETEQRDAQRDDPLAGLSTERLQERRDQWAKSLNWFENATPHQQAEAVRKQQEAQRERDRQRAERIDNITGGPTRPYQGYDSPSYGGPDHRRGHGIGR